MVIVPSPEIRSLAPYGAREFGVDEPNAGLHSNRFELKASQAVLPMVFDVIVEPKELLGADLIALVGIHGSFQKVALDIGASEAFVRQTAKNSKRPLCAPAEP